MVEKSKSPFMAAAMAAKAVATNPKVPVTKTTQVQQAKAKKPVKSTNKRKE